MHLSELKQKHVSELLDIALELDVENASRLRKQELMFAILKKRAKAGELNFGDGTLEVYLMDSVFYVLPFLPILPALTTFTSLLLKSAASISIPATQLKVKSELQKTENATLR